jgi:hypothetical protein
MKNATLNINEGLRSAPSQPQSREARFKVEVQTPIDVVIAPFAYDESKTNYQLCDAALDIKVNEQPLHQGSLPAATSHIKIRDLGDQTYTLTATKSGYIDYVGNFTHEELKATKDIPIKVIFDKLDQILASPVSPFIVVDQFGYRPVSEKIAVIRDPGMGWDADQQFTPGPTYELINAATGKVLFQSKRIEWMGEGQYEATSGDRVSWFDFSAITAPGEYFIYDRTRKARSDIFKIDQAVYRDVLVQALRTFYYQRSGFAKVAPYAGEGWQDGASHQQDVSCLWYGDEQNSSSPTRPVRNLLGGWYDAGDYNKYTNWAAAAIIGLLQAYQDYPSAFDNDIGIPESGNGIPDILDEVKWGMDFLVKLQDEDDGSVLSIVGSKENRSPPSASTGSCLYGDATTAATLNTAAAFALGAKLFGAQPGQALRNYADTLLTKAEKAYTWAELHPDVVFDNGGKIGGGNQEVDDSGRLVAKITAAVYLYDVTGKAAYRQFVVDNYEKVPGLYKQKEDAPALPALRQDEQELLLYFARLLPASDSVATAIRSKYAGEMINGWSNFPIHSPHNIRNFDPYMAHTYDYGWGTNKVKAARGLMFTKFIQYELDPTRNQFADNIAQRYLHYIHGVNPMNLVYLSNMYQFGAYKSVGEIYHAWFSDGTPQWDRVGVSEFGPPPGYMVGGVNPYYWLDSKCLNGAYDYQPANEICASPLGQQTIAIPRQPKQKAYLDFNAGWPLGSWQISEPAIGYQYKYIKLLARYGQ